MASKDKIDEVIRLISSRYRIDFQLEDMAGWQSVLAGMTNAQVAVAEQYLNHDYRGQFPPQPADFKAWGKTAPAQYATVKQPDENYQIERISKSEYAKRVKCLGEIMSGKRHPDLDWKGIKANIADREMRDWLRKHLGWSPIK
ncbi:MAG: hypothetical protein V3W44_08655 [Dehalococcoidales bacterium]